MWLVDYMTKNKGNNKVGSCGSVTSSSNGNVAVSASLEHRNVPIVAPYGVMYNPPENSKSVILDVAGTYMCLGVVSRYFELEPGELKLESKGGATIVLKNDGTVHINGKVYGE